MCGIVGFWGPGGEAAGLRATALSMAEALLHRGPDAGDAWVDEAQGLALGHRRLAIVELSPLGAQPMASADGRYQVAFNGEIYNHNPLREELSALGHRFRGHSDTEVLLAGVLSWGLEGTLRRCRGMWAIALWDRAEGRLQLARDRAGEKPLYFGRQGPTFMWASELKGLRAHPHFEGRLDPTALALGLVHNYIPGPESIHLGIQKLRPGTILTLEAPDAEARVQAYWSIDEAVRAGRANPLPAELGVVAGEVSSVLRAAVAEQMVADVPVGAFLSGGIDSSLVVAYMQQASSRPVKTFTIGFEDPAFDEAPHAEAIAKHLGTDHSTWRISDADALSVVPKLPWAYDEPFADSSQIPTMLVAELAKRQVTVSLSGDAGDELFAGYERYLWAEGLNQRLQRLPDWVRQLGARGIHAIPPSWIQQSHGLLAPALGRLGRVSDPAQKARKLATILSTEGDQAIYKGAITLWQDQVLVPSSGQPDLLSRHDHAFLGKDMVAKMQLWDFKTYLPDDILVKVDRAGMAVALESRIPLLDARMIELAWRVPHACKLAGGRGKLPLRHLLAQEVPSALFERPKKGFGVPLAAWLRGPLRGWAGDLLSPEALRRSGLLQPEPILKSWAAHLSGQRDEHYPLWGVLMFQAWLDASARR